DVPARIAAARVPVRDVERSDVGVRAEEDAAGLVQIAELDVAAGEPRVAGLERSAQIPRSTDHRHLPHAMLVDDAREAEVITEQLVGGQPGQVEESAEVEVGGERVVAPVGRAEMAGDLERAVLADREGAQELELAPRDVGFASDGGQPAEELRLEPQAAP